jgi:hypothetical protein
MSFTFKKIDEKVMKDKSKVQTLQVYKTNKTPMTYKQVIEIANTIKGKLPSHAKFNIKSHSDKILDDNVSIRGLSHDGWKMLKTYDKDLYYGSEEDYINGSSEITTGIKNKSKDIYQLQISLTKKY